MTDHDASACWRRRCEDAETTPTPPLDTEAQARSLPSVRAVRAIEGYGEQWKTDRRAAIRAITAQACEAAGVIPGAYEARFLDGMAEWEPERNGTLANLLMRFYEAGKAETP